MEDRKYIPVTWGDVGRFFLAVALFALSVLNLFLLIQAWKLLGLGSLSKQQTCSFGQLAICWVLIGEYALISGLAICLTALVKEGFKNLKPVKKKGLMLGIIIGLIFGLISGLILWSIGESLGGLIFGLISGLILWLIIGLILEFI